MPRVGVDFPRDPEVGQQRSAAIRVQEDVLRLHVAMHDAVPMRVAKRVRDVPEDALGLFGA